MGDSQPSTTPLITAVVVVEFVLDEGETFQPILEVMREAFNASVVARPIAVHGAIREAADRVLAALTTAPPEPEESA